jgi:hypothetical protein
MFPINFFCVGFFNANYWAKAGSGSTPVTSGPFFVDAAAVWQGGAEAGQVTQ